MSAISMHIPIGQLVLSAPAAAVTSQGAPSRGQDGTIGSRDGAGSQSILQRQGQLIALSIMVLCSILTVASCIREASACGWDGMCPFAAQHRTCCKGN